MMLVKGRRCPTFHKIKFAPAAGRWYRWIASVSFDEPEVVFIHDHKLAWDRDSYEKIYEHLIDVFAHEAMHIICDWLGESGRFDRIRLKYIKQLKKQCPKTWGKWYF